MRCCRYYWSDYRCLKMFLCHENVALKAVQDICWTKSHDAIRSPKWLHPSGQKSQSGCSQKWHLVGWEAILKAGVGPFLIFCFGLGCSDLWRTPQRLTEKTFSLLTLFPGGDFYKVDNYLLRSFVASLGRILGSKSTPVPYLCRQANVSSKNIS